MQVWAAVRADDGEDAEAIARSRHTWDDFGVFSVESVTPDDDREPVYPCCAQCGVRMNPVERMLGAVCGSCVRANHRAVVGR